MSDEFYQELLEIVRNYEERIQCLEMRLNRTEQFLYMHGYVVLDPIEEITSSDIIEEFEIEDLEETRIMKKGRKTVCIRGGNN
jgi:hypothetical protein